MEVLLDLSKNKTMNMNEYALTRMNDVFYYKSGQSKFLNSFKVYFLFFISSFVVTNFEN